MKRQWIANFSLYAFKREMNKNASLAEASRLIKLTTIIAVTLQVSACATKDVAFRPLSPAANECQIYAASNYSTKLQDNLTSEKKLNESAILGSAVGCYEQKDQLRLEDSSNFIRYQLNFLEFKENGELREPGQWDAIRNALNKKEGSKYVVIFVHGWRHDARPDDSNVQSFRTMLAYSAKYLHDRAEYGDNAQVLGIYIGWPGNEWQWAWEDQAQVPAFLTFWSRKKESEYLAPYVSDYIYRIRDRINDENNVLNLNRFLIVGHSFGGNLLINALKQDYKNAIPDVKKMHSPIKGISDLTVLLNPASDFSNWKEIQKIEYERSGYHQPPEYKSFFNNHIEFFDARQKPILMSITSTCDWKKASSGITKDEKHGSFDCDWATGWAFPIGQILALRIDPDQYQALGHVRAYSVPERTELAFQNYGVTHELEDITTDEDVKNREHGFKTVYINAAKAINRCPVAGDWFSKVQKETGREWDTNTENGEDHPYAIPSISKYNIQMRHGVFRQKLRHFDKNEPFYFQKAYSTLGPAHEPFWNVASHESIVPDHNTVFSKQLLCLLNQIVLDP